MAQKFAISRPYWNMVLSVGTLPGVVVRDVLQSSALLLKGTAISRAVALRGVECECGSARC